MEGVHINQSYSNITLTTIFSNTDLSHRLEYENLSSCRVVVTEDLGDLSSKRSCLSVSMAPKSSTRLVSRPSHSNSHTLGEAAYHPSIHPWIIHPSMFWRVQFSEFSAFFWRVIQCSEPWDQSMNSWEANSKDTGRSARMRRPNCSSATSTSERRTRFYLGNNLQDVTALRVWSQIMGTAARPWTVGFFN